MEGITVTKCFDFCYGHYLPEYVGKCKNHHGHNSRVEVEFTKVPNREEYPGMVIDFTLIRGTIKPFIEMLDHKFLNDLAQFSDTPPTAENIVTWLKKKIQGTHIGGGLIRIRMSETPDSWAEWKRGY